MMERLTRRVLQHKRLVAVGWILLTLVGIAAAGPASKALDQKFTRPRPRGLGDQPGRSRSALRHRRRHAAAGPGRRRSRRASRCDSPGVRAELRQLERRVARALPGARVAGFGSTGDRAFVSRDGRTTFVVAYPPPDPTQPVRRQPEGRAARCARRCAGATRRRRAVHLTGFDALTDAERRARRPGRPRRGAARRRSARCVVLALRVRLVAGLRAAADGDRRRS